MITNITPTQLKSPAGAYSYATACNGFLFISGLLPVTSNGEKLTDASFADQVHQVLKNLDHILETGGTTSSNLVQVRVYISNIEHWAEFNQIYTDWIGTARPARCVVPVPNLHYGFAIEIEGTAHIPQ